jgi:hypothetical protein
MTYRATVVLAGSLLLITSGAGSQESAARPLYTNAEVVSVDPATRIVVIKNSAGATETLELDDSQAGMVGVKVGDRVMLTVRGEPGRRRISAITKATASQSPADVRSDTSITPPGNADPARSEIKERFADQVSSLSERARSIDQVWSSFVTSCDAKPSSSYEGGRDWFGLWDGRVKADLSNGFCRDLFNQIVASGEGIKKGMAAAEDVARKTLDAGEIRDIRTLKSMDWDGWALPAPDQLEP